MTVQVCAVGLLLWTCTSSSPKQEEMLSYSCATPPENLNTCTVDADCATVAMGCYCGAQPVNGVARKYATAAQGCQDAAAASCDLGCASEPGMVAQDGSKVEAGKTLAARCDRSSGVGTCKSYVFTGSGDPPPPTGW